MSSQGPLTIVALDHLALDPLYLPQTQWEISKILRVIHRDQGVAVMVAEFYETVGGILEAGNVI